MIRVFHPTADDRADTVVLRSSAPLQVAFAVWWGFVSSLELLMAARSHLPRWLFDRAQTSDVGFEQVEAAVLLVDMAGFTALTNRLNRHGQVGSEETVTHLNRWFEAVLGPVHERHGDVVAFGGDAFTALFTGPDASSRLRTAAAAGWEIAQELETSARLGLADGTVTLATAGNEESKQPMAIGPAVRMASAAIVRARVGEVHVHTPAPGLELGDVGNGIGMLLRGPASGEVPERADDLRTRVSGLVVDAGSVVLERLKPFLPSSVWAELLLPPEPGEHRIVTTLFARYGEITAAVELDEVTAALDQALEVLSRSGGYVQKIESADKGTAVLAFFGVPVAMQDAPGRASAAAMELTTAESFAVSITTGRVFAGDVGSRQRHEFTAIGEPVNRAARMLQAVPVGEVWCDPVTAAAAASYGFGEVEHIEAKGFEDGVPIRVLRSVLDESEVPTSAQAPLVGRDDAMEMLRSRIRGDPSPIVLLGEVGLGKTRLLQEVAQSARLAGQRVCFGHFGGPRAFSAFAELADALGVPGRNERDQLLARLAAGIDMTGQRVLICLEDLHLADEDDATLWRDLIPLLPGLGASMICTARPSATVQLPGERFHLLPLGMSDALELVRFHAPDALQAVASEIVRRAGGNPLFLEQLAMQKEGGELPRTIEEAIRVRMDRLPPLHRRVLQTASIWVGDFDLRALDALVSEEGSAPVEEAVSALLQHSFLVPAGGARWRFGHDLDRRVAYSAMAFAQRQSLHRHALEILERSGDPDPAEVYIHLEAVDDGRRAGEAAASATVLAVEAAAGVRAVRFANLALERLEDPAARCRVQVEKAHGLMMAMQRREAAEVAEQAEKDALALDLPGVAGRAMKIAAQAYSFMTEYAASDASVNRGLRLASDLDDDGLRAPLLMVRGWNAWGRGLYPDARAALERAAELAPTEDERVRVHSSLVSVLIQLGEYRLARKYLLPPDWLENRREAAMLFDHAEIAFHLAEREVLRDLLARTEVIAQTRTRFVQETQMRLALLREMEGRWAEAEPLRTKAIRAHLEADCPYEAKLTRMQGDREQLLAGAFTEARAAFEDSIDGLEDIEAADEVARAEVLAAIAGRFLSVPLEKLADVATRNRRFADRSGRWVLEIELGVLLALIAPPAGRKEAFGTVVAMCQARRDRASERFVRLIAYWQEAHEDTPEAAARWVELTEELRSWGCPEWTHGGPQQPD